MKKIMNSKLYIIILGMLLFLLFMYKYCIFFSLYADNLWNFGASLNMAKGMLPYKDFNLLAFPLSNFLILPLVKLFDYKMIAYFIALSIFLVGIVYLAYKLNKKSVFIVIILLLIENYGSYNALALLFALLLMLLERKKSNDYLFGIVIGLAVMTKQVMLLLIIPTLLTKDIKVILKRFLGACLPWCILLIYLLINNIFFDFINYTVLGVFDFGSNNAVYDYFIGWIILNLLCLKKYINTKNKDYIYAICISVLSVPIFDINHFMLSLVVFVIVLINFDNEIKVLKKINLKACFIALICLYIFIGYDFLKNEDAYIETNSNSAFYLVNLDRSLTEWNKNLYKYYSKHIEKYDIYFVDIRAYYFKIANNLPVNKFDLSLYGNNGYNGTYKFMDTVKHMKNPTLFLVSKYQNEKTISGQHNMRLVNFIKDNYNKVDSFNDIVVYEIKN